MYKGGKPTKIHWDNGLLICTHCKIYKEESNFSPDKKEKYRNFKSSHCHSCLNERSEEYRKSKKDDLHYYLNRLLHGINNKLKNTKKSSKKYQSLDINITLQDLKDLYLKQEKLCSISGIEMTHITGEGRTHYNISIDRIDSNKGYVKDNIHLTCSIVNTMKSDLDISTFKNICKIIINKK